MLYGSKFYSNAVDVWGAGCVMAELFKRGHIFPGQSDIDQLTKIFQLRGTPDVIDFVIIYFVGRNMA